MYALGRPIEATDQAAINGIFAATREEETIRAIIKAIASTSAFQRK